MPSLSLRSEGEMNDSVANTFGGESEGACDIMKTDIKQRKDGRRMSMPKQFVLASGSKRRRELLAMLDVSFEVIKPGVDETLDETMSIEHAVMDLALRKAKAVLRQKPRALVLACDTLVMVGDTLLGKPEDKDHAREMFMTLRGETNRVISGCALIDDTHEEVYYGEAFVTFSQMSDEEIEAYISTEEPYDKSGGYGIQGPAAKHIDTMRGDYYSVMGLPMHKTYVRLKRRGVL